MSGISNTQLMQAIKDQDKFCPHNDSLAKLPALIKTVDKMYQRLFEENGESICGEVKQNKIDIDGLSKDVAKLKERPKDENGKPINERKWSWKFKLAIATFIIGNIGIWLTVINWLNTILEPLRKAIIP